MRSSKKPSVETVSLINREGARFGSVSLVPSATGQTLSLLPLARSLAAGVRHGRHRSLARGGSAEFYDYRAYSPGDSLRHLDWRLLGRTDRAYLRRHQHECRISLILVVDASASMDFAGIDEEEGTRQKARGMSRPTKLRRACELAAALAYIAVKGGDEVGLVIADGEWVTIIKPAAGRSALHHVIRALDGALSFRRQAPATPREPNSLARGLLAARAIIARGSVVVALSDALDEAGPVLDAVSRLRFAPAGVGPRCDAALVQILSDDELTPPLAAPARLVDVERRLSINASAEDVGGEYARAIRAHIASLRRGLIAARGRFVLHALSSTPLDALRDLLRD